MTALAILNRDEVIERIKAGQKLTDIAHSLGYKDHSAIVHRLKDDPEYPIAREIGVEARMEARESEMESATESVTVARARELLSHARWRAEREFPHRWGNKTEVTHELGQSFEMLLADISAKRQANAVQQDRVIDGESHYVKSEDAK